MRKILGVEIEREDESALLKFAQNTPNWNELSETKRRNIVKIFAEGNGRVAVIAPGDK